MPADSLTVARELITRARELAADALAADGPSAASAALGLVPALADLAESALDLPVPRVVDVTVDDLDGTRTGASLTDSPLSPDWGVRLTIGVDEYPNRTAHLDAGTALTFGEGITALATEAIRRNRAHRA